MKPRAKKTYKILAVALTAAAAGCNKAVVPDPSTEPTAESISQEAPAAKSGDPAPTAVANAPGHAADVPAAQAVHAPPEGRPMSTDPALVALRGELKKAGREGAIARVSHFRPLCDEDGYPLVGNVVMGKGESDHYQPSAFCDEIRQQARR